MSQTTKEKIKGNKYTRAPCVQLLTAKSQFTTSREHCLRSFPYLCRNSSLSRSSSVYLYKLCLAYKIRGTKNTSSCLYNQSTVGNGDFQTLLRRFFILTLKGLFDSSILTSNWYIIDSKRSFYFHTPRYSKVKQRKGSEKRFLSCSFFFIPLVAIADHW